MPVASGGVHQGSSRRSEVAERVYAESDWAVRRWDRFNDKLVKPLSFCHFWRTVLLYATVQQLLAPWRAVVRRVW